MKMGSAGWRLQVQLKRKPWLLLIPLIFLIMIFSASCAWLTDETTGSGSSSTLAGKAGQPIYDGWSYNGTDSAGNLIFQKGEKVILLSSESGEVTLDDQRFRVTVGKDNIVKLTPVSDSDVSSGFPSGLLGLLAGVAIGLILSKKTNQPRRRKWVKARR